MATRRGDGGRDSSAPVRPSTLTRGSSSPPTSSVAVRAQRGRRASHADGREWGSRFPCTSIRDQVDVGGSPARAHRRHAHGGRCRRVDGRMRAIEWAVSHPERVDRSIVLASTAARLRTRSPGASRSYSPSSRTRTTPVATTTAPVGRPRRASASHVGSRTSPIAPSPSSVSASAATPSCVRTR